MDTSRLTHKNREDRGQTHWELKSGALGQWVVFFGFVCELLTAPSLENRPTGILVACICVIGPATEPSWNDRHPCRDRAGPHQEPRQFLRGPADGRICRLAGIMFPESLKGKGEKKSNWNGQVYPKAGGLDGKDEDPSLFHWLSSQLFLFCQMYWN